jgi:hypothetical protein
MNQPISCVTTQARTGIWNLALTYPRVSLDLFIDL